MAQGVTTHFHARQVDGGRGGWVGVQVDEHGFLAHLRGPEDNLARRWGSAGVHGEWFPLAYDKLHLGCSKSVSLFLGFHHGGHPDVLSPGVWDHAPLGGRGGSRLLGVNGEQLAHSGTVGAPHTIIALLNRNRTPFIGIVEKDVVIVQIGCQPFWILCLLGLLLQLVEVLEPFHWSRVTSGYNQHHTHIVPNVLVVQLLQIVEEDLTILVKPRSGVLQHRASSSHYRLLANPALPVAVATHQHNLSQRQPQLLRRHRLRAGLREPHTHIPDSVSPPLEVPQLGLRSWLAERSKQFHKAEPILVGYCLRVFRAPNRH